VARQILEYGAFCAARSAVVADWDGATPERIYDDALTAAAIPISRIAGASGFEEAASWEELTIPGWGALDGYPAAKGKTRLARLDLDAEGASTVLRCELRHDYELMVPVGGMIVYRVGDALLALREAHDADATDLARPPEYHREPHLINFKASCAYVRLAE
jgi:hypothetical protein